MILTIISHINAVRLLFIIGISLTVLPIFLYNTVLKNNEKFKKIMGYVIAAGIAMSLPMFYYFYLCAKYDVGSFTLEDTLYLAAENKNLKAARKLVNDGADPVGKNRYGRTAAFRACMLDDADMLRLFIGCGIDPNAAGTESKTMLAAACENHCHETVKILLDAGANPDYRPDVYVPAIHYAAMDDDKYDSVLIEMLINAGADPASSAYRNGKEMLPFRYYFDTHKNDEDITPEEESRYERIKELLYEPYIEWLNVKMEREGAAYYEETVS